MKTRYAGSCETLIPRNPLLTYKDLDDTIKHFHEVHFTQRYNRPGSASGSFWALNSPKRYLLPLIPKITVCFICKFVVRIPAVVTPGDYRNFSQDSVISSGGRVFGDRCKSLIGKRYYSFMICFTN